MKKIYAVLLFLFVTTISIAQGISVQGIARDNASSAILDEILTFTFSITKDDNTELYAEEQSIRTDNFGVFSHIVSTGNPQGGTVFNDIDFEIENLKLKVFVNYNNVNISVYDQTLQYTPYAHFAKKAANAKTADNGVPPGAIMPYLGTTAPTGWVFCKGQSLTSVAGSETLRAIVGSNAPNLQGLFLRGTGDHNVNHAGPNLKSVQGQSIGKHDHYASLSGYTGSNGSHNHANGSWNYVSRLAVGNNSPEGTNSNNAGGAEPDIITVKPMSTAGNHYHSVSVSGTTNDNSTVYDNRPINYGVNYIIKL